MKRKEEKRREEKRRERSVKDRIHGNTCASGPSIIIFIHNICIGFRGFGLPIKLFKATKLRAATDVLN